MECFYPQLCTHNKLYEFQKFVAYKLLQIVFCVVLDFNLINVHLKSDGKLCIWYTLGGCDGTARVALTVGIFGHFFKKKHTNTKQYSSSSKTTWPETTSWRYT